MRPEDIDGIPPVGQVWCPGPERFPGRGRCWREEHGEARNSRREDLRVAGVACRGSWAGALSPSQDLGLARKRMMGRQSWATALGARVGQKPGRGPAGSH